MGIMPLRFGYCPVLTRIEASNARLYFHVQPSWFYQPQSYGVEQRVVQHFEEHARHCARS